MTREQAKIYVLLGKEKLKIITPHLAREFESLTAFSLGHALQYRRNLPQMNAQNRVWKDCATDVCTFDPKLTYRVKPKGDSKSWVPELGEVYGYLDLRGGTIFICCRRNVGEPIDKVLISSGNFYKQDLDNRFRDEAIQKLENTFKKP